MTIGYGVLGWVIAIGVSVLAVWLHYESLTLLGRWIARMSDRRRVFVTLACLIVTHILEIFVFAVVYALMSMHPNLGTIVDLEQPVDYVYYSSVVYTTVGFGDLYPLGAIRYVTALESLIGLVLITWSATFMFMNREDEEKSSSS